MPPPGNPCARPNMITDVDLDPCACRRCGHQTPPSPSHSGASDSLSIQGLRETTDQVAKDLIRASHFDHTRRRDDRDVNRPPLRTRQGTARSAAGGKGHVGRGVFRRPASRWNGVGRDRV